MTVYSQYTRTAGGQKGGEETISGNMINPIWPFEMTRIHGILWIIFHRALSCITTTAEIVALRIHSMRLSPARSLSENTDFNQIYFRYVADEIHICIYRWWIWIMHNITRYVKKNWERSVIKRSEKHSDFYMIPVYRDESDHVKMLNVFH